MALLSPGVEVTVIDQSQYLPSAANSVPFVLVATAQDKANPNGTGVAEGTTAANAGKLWRITSQRDLVTVFGNPYFYTVNGTPVQGGELNEYGLLAAYSALGATNSCYVLRADVDLASLVGSSGRPVGEPTNGTYWLDTTESTWGLYEFNSSTGLFSLQTPIVITDSSSVVGDLPAPGLGNIGSYAVIAIPNYDQPTATAAGTYFYKNANNTWVQVGTRDWLASVATITGTASFPTLTAGNTFQILLGNNQTATITVPSSPNNTVNGVALAINNLGWENLSAAVNADGKIEFYNSNSAVLPSAAQTIQVGGGTGTVLADMGITAGTYYAPLAFYGNSAQQPLWQAGQAQPRPSGSVWVKVGSSGNGLVPVVSEYSSTLNAWVAKNVGLYTSDMSAIDDLDATGGQAIPAGTVYAQYNYNGDLSSSPVYFWERISEGATIITGDNTAPAFNDGPYASDVYVSVPNSSALDGPYRINLGDGADAADFVLAWQQAGIPYTDVEVLDSGALQLTHTEGGVIIVNDNTDGEDNGMMVEAGFVIGTTSGVKYGPYANYSWNSVATAAVSSAGTGLTLNVINSYGQYGLNGINNSGSGYAVGDIVKVLGTSLGGTTPSNDLVVEITAVIVGAVTGVTYVSGSPVETWQTQLSNWVEFDYVANEGAPVAEPANNQNWYYSVTDQVDILVNYNGNWKGYKNVGFDANGFPSPTPVVPAGSTDPNGPIISASEPTTQSDGTALVYGDLWISTANLELYPLIYRWQSVDGVNQWVLVDNADQTSPQGVLFADARWATNGTTSPTDDPIPTIKALLTSNYLDIDAPSASNYPVGMLLWNTRRSGYNVKQYKANYFNATSFPDATLPSEKNAWVSASGLQSNGSPYMGRKAQRAMVVQAMKATLDSNLDIRDEDNFFNMMATPNYPELQPNMVLLNGDRNETGYIIGDTPMRLPDTGTAITAWATNAAGATSTGEEGCVTRSQYMGLFYPSGLTNDLSGNLVVVPPSHMMLRTFLRNDEIAYPWLAPAGTRRGIIDNAVNIGYLNGTTGEFVPIKTRLGIRNTLYENFINPLVFFTGNGLLNYGNKNSFTQSGVDGASALDRINVARLVAYIRRQLTVAARPFVFEPNDATTRKEISGVVESLMLDLVAKRGLYDYLVVCDESNNTPARIDRNELWIDVAIEPVKAAEFIYIPVRILNTGELSA
jgi:Phage tail sheath C-terminal domain